MPIGVQVMLAVLGGIFAYLAFFLIICIVIDVCDIRVAEEMRRTVYAIKYIDAKIKVLEARKDLYQYVSDMTAVARLMDTYDYEEANKMWDSLYIVYNSARW